MDSITDAGNKFLSLPNHYDLDVHDLLHFTLSDPPHNDDVLKDTTTGAGALLVSKILDGLRNWKASSGEGGSHDDSEVAKVGGLAERNLYSVHSRQVAAHVERIKLGEDGSAPIALDVPRMAVELLLKGLHDPTVTRTGGVRINSNEPVLLINFDRDGFERMGSAGRDTLNYVVDIARTELHAVWNIWPVRIYAGAFLPGAAGEASECAVPDFSITLLNVVNTDIGGPSMPQLLDAPCAAPEWNRMVRKEVWRDRELVSREDGTGGFEQHDADDASERSVASGDDDDESVRSDAPGLVILRNMQGEQRDVEEHVAGDAENDQQEGPTIDDAQVEYDPLTAQHLGFAADDDNGDDGSSHKQETAEAGTHEQPPPQEIEQPARHIEHPTWDRHDDRTSLFDLIRSQASLIPPFGLDGAGHGVADLEGDVAESKPARAESASSFEDTGPVAAGAESAHGKPPSDDDFVVV